MLQTVTFREDDNLASALARQRESTLQAYFELTARNPDARSILYHDIPGKYTYDCRARAWHRRRGHDQAVGRMIYAAPAQGERFYLRLLLTQVAGAISFEDLRTFQVLMISASPLRSMLIVIVILQAIVTSNIGMTSL